MRRHILLSLSCFHTVRGYRDSHAACFFRQRVSVALQRAQTVAVRRRTMAFDVAHAGLPSLPPPDPLHGLDIAHIAGLRFVSCSFVRVFCFVVPVLCASSFRPCPFLCFRCWTPFVFDDLKICFSPIVLSPRDLRLKLAINHDLR